MEAGKKIRLRLGLPQFFLSSKEKRQIIEAIRFVEKNSSAEIRVHLAKKTNGDIIEEAKKVFYSIGMDKTIERNGVLFFLSIKDRKFAIIGDSGINEKVGENFWKEIATEMENYFRKDLFGEGLEYGIYKVGEILREHFPHKENDVNELPDNISFG